MVKDGVVDSAEVGSIGVLCGFFECFGFFDHDGDLNGSASTERMAGTMARATTATDNFMLGYQRV